MLDFRKNSVAIKALVAIFIIACFIVYYVSILISCKKERAKYIRDDSDDNFSKFFLADDDLEASLKRHISDIDHIIFLRKQIKILNEYQTVQIQAATMKRVPLVIVVQVHNRIMYLFEFLKSLQKVMGIPNTVVIFSHDFYDEAINDLISQVKFVTVIQIFYPYSRQLHPNIFPGDDQKHCYEGWHCVKAKPGERNATLAQLKHHWWWKANYVFDHLEIMKPYDGFVVFLEEDQYLTEDFLYVLRVMHLAQKSSYRQCDLLSVGAYPPLLAKYDINTTLLIEEFGTTPYSMGIAFDRKTWKRIKKLSYQFCYYDDYDWASSLRFLSTRLPEGKLNMLSIAGARVIHFGRCGINSQVSDCDISDKMKVLNHFLAMVKKNLFPKDFIIEANDRYDNLEKRGNFSDVRDHELCMYFAKDSRVK